MEKLDVSLVLPCYNEKVTFLDSINRIMQTLDDFGRNWEIIFVDDGSIDGTKELIQETIKKYPQRSLRAYFHKLNQGRGQTVIDGLLEAKGQVVGFIDIDLEVGEWYLPKFIKAIEEGADSAVAWRIYDFNLSSILRWFSSKGYSFLRQIVLGLPYKDTEGGYKFFNKKKIIPIIKKCQYKGWFWDTEIMARIYKAGFKVKEIPVAFVRRFDKTSTVRLIPDSFAYLKDLLSFKNPK